MHERPEASPWPLARRRHDALRPVSDRRDEQIRLLNEAWQRALSYMDTGELIDEEPAAA